MERYPQKMSGYHRANDYSSYALIQPLGEACQWTGSDYHPDTRTQCNSEDNQYEAEQSRNAIIPSGSDNLKDEVGYHKVVMLLDDQLRQNQSIEYENKLWAKIKKAKEENATIIHKYLLNADRIARIEQHLRCDEISAGKNLAKAAPKRCPERPWRAKADKRVYEISVARLVWSHNKKMKLGEDFKKTEIFNGGMEEMIMGAEQAGLVAEIQRLQSQVDSNQEQNAHRIQRIYLNEARMVSIQRELFRRDRLEAAAVKAVCCFCIHE